MKVLGVRIGGGKARIAVVVGNSDTAEILGLDGETRLVFPTGTSSIDEKVLWLFREMERIHEDHRDLERICIKTNEYTQRDTKAKRESAYLEAAVMLFCGLKKIPMSVFTYASLSTRRKKTMDDASNRVGKLRRYWDEQAADAVNAAWRGLRESR